MTREPGKTHATIVATLCGVGLVAAACGNGPALTGPSKTPSATAIGAVPAQSVTRATDGASTTQLRFAVDLTVPAYPTCALTPPSAGVISGTGLLTIVIRSTADTNGGEHVGTTIHGHGTATDQTGARWVWSDADLNNEVFPSGNTSSHSFTQTIVEQFHVIGPKGEQVMIQGTFHVTQVNGTTVVEFEKGNHEEDEVCESGFVLTPLP